MADLQTSLFLYLKKTLPERADLAVENFHLLNSGWESEVYGFDLISRVTGQLAREALALRAYSGEQGAAKAEIEAVGMRQLHRAGYPIPAVFLMEVDSNPLGQPFLLMERVDGSPLWPLLFPVDSPDKQALFERFAGLLVQLHRLDWRQFAADPRPIEQGGTPYLLAGLLAQWKSYVTEAEAPGFYSALRRVEEQLAELPPARPAPVHLDFHPGNILLAPDGRMVVLDWTQFCLSDPRLDLAWTLILLGSNEGWPVRDIFLAEYERQMGARVVGIEVFEVLSCLKRLFSVAISFAAGAEALGMREGALEQMREQMGSIEQVYRHFQQLSGQRLPEVEHLLGGFMKGDQS